MRLNDRLTNHWDTLKKDELRDLQGKRLHRFLKHQVVPFSAHYREVFQEAGIDPGEIRSIEDLSRIPFSSKSTLIDDEGIPKTRDFVLVPDEKILSRRPSTIMGAAIQGRAAVKAGFEKEYRPVLMTSTTGRSAEPIPFLYTQHDLDNLATTGRRLMEVCDSRPDYRHLNLFPYAPHLAFWQAHYAGLGYNTFTLSTGGGKVMGTEGNVRLLAKIKPDALIGMPTFIYHVLQVAMEKGLHCPNVRRIVLGGEKVPEGLRRKLRALCAELGSGNVEVMATYGFTESKMAFPECPARGGEATGYHLYPDLGIVEVIDPDTGEVLPDGVPGEVVFSPLDSRGSVVLRYRTGDLISGGITHERCPACGGRMPRLLGRISRVSDVKRMNIGKVKGTLVNFNDLEHVLDDLAEVGTWQIELRKRNNDPLESDEIIVHVSARGRGGREEIRDRITERFAASTEIRPNAVEFHDAADLRRRHGVGKALKEEKVVDRRGEAAPRAETTPNPVSHYESS